MSKPVSVSNVAATVLDTLGLPRLPGNERRIDLLDPPDTLPPVFIEHRGPNEWVGVLRVDSLKYTRILEAAFVGENGFLHDLRADPAESKPIPITDHDGPRIERLRDSLRELRSSWLDAPESNSKRDLRDEQIEILRKLGYVAPK